MWVVGGGTDDRRTYLNDVWYGALDRGRRAARSERVRFQWRPVDRVRQLRGRLQRI